MCAGSHGQTAGHSVGRPMPSVPALGLTKTLTRDGWFCFSWICPNCGSKNSGSGYPEDGSKCFCQCGSCESRVKVTGI